MTIGMTGGTSNIARYFVKHIGDEELDYQAIDTLSLDHDKYLICSGILYGQSISDITNESAARSFDINFVQIARFCDALFRKNQNARVCIIGSESGVNGSYDMAYAGSKAALHLYVETKKLLYEKQHLVCVSPTIIEDSGMTQRRDDLEAVIKRGEERRMKRWLNSAEVARVAYFALNELALSNTVVHVTGGNW